MAKATFENGIDAAGRGGKSAGDGGFLAERALNLAAEVIGARVARDRHHGKAEAEPGRACVLRTAFGAGLKASRIGAALKGHVDDQLGARAAIAFQCGGEEGAGPDGLSGGRAAIFVELRQAAEPDGRRRADVDQAVHIADIVIVVPAHLAGFAAEEFADHALISFRVKVRAAVRASQAGSWIPARFTNAI